MLEGKQIGYVWDLIREHQLDSAERVREQGKHANFGSDPGFTLKDKRALGLSDEDRSYEDRFVFERTVFDCRRVSLQNSTEIDLRDCIVLGDLSISVKHKKEMRVFLDSCVITGAITIWCNGAQLGSLALHAVHAKELVLDDLAARDLFVTSSRFAAGTLSRLQVDKFHCSENHFGFIDVADSELKDVHFPGGQVSIDALRDPRGRKAAIAKFNPFLRAHSDFATAADRMVEQEEQRRTITTLDFLLERTGTAYRRSDLAKLRYFRALAETRGVLERVLVIVSGGLLSPVRLALVSCICILVFAAAYRLLDPGKPGESILAAIYFSGVTFTTIGYGDMVPEGITRLLAILEGLLGIALAGAFVASLIRRHVEKD